MKKTNPRAQEWQEIFQKRAELDNLPPASQDYKSIKKEIAETISHILSLTPKGSGALYLKPLREIKTGEQLFHTNMSSVMEEVDGKLGFGGGLMELYNDVTPDLAGLTPYSD